MSNITAATAENLSTIVAGDTVALTKLAARRGDGWLVLSVNTDGTLNIFSGRIRKTISTDKVLAFVSAATDVLVEGDWESEYRFSFRRMNGF